MKRFAETVARALEVLSPPQGLLLATSAGADSTALLASVASESRRRRGLQGVRLVLGHVRHHLRSDAETEADEAVVRAHAQAFGLEFIARSVTVGQAGGLEQAARQARYDALADMARVAELGAVVTGHTATDQAETMLLRLVRGTGARGLGGMSPDRPLGEVRLLRPMLGVTRDEARAYCLNAGLRFRDDPTNVELRPRVRLRTEVLPVLESMSPGAVRRLASAASRLRDEDAFLDASAADAGDDIVRLRALPSVLLPRAIGLWCEHTLGTRRRVSSAHVEALVHLVETGRGEVALPGARGNERVARIHENRLVVVPHPPLNPSARLARPSDDGGAGGTQGPPE